MAGTKGSNHASCQFRVDAVQQRLISFSAMLRVNTSLVLQLPTIDTAVRDERLIESHNQMLIEQRLNEVGRERLLPSSNHTTTEEWGRYPARFEQPCCQRSPALFKVSCLYSLLRLNPTVLSMLK
jgi:hypothetical protein